MGSISTVFCWVGGVITPSLSETLIHVLQSDTGVTVDFGRRALIQKLTQDFVLGKIDFRFFCEQIDEIVQGSFTVNALESAILESIEVRLPVVEVLCDLPTTYQVWLISDYPPEWFTLISKEIHQFPLVHPDRLIFIRDSSLLRLIPDVFYYVVRKANKDISDCMLISADSKQTVEAIRHGFSSEVFVDARRLRKEFNLRKMLPA